jgi:thiol:disulfide interchange protein DsbD
MKKIIFLFPLFLVLSIGMQAQVSDPVKWTFSAKKKTANTYEVVISAVFAKPWQLYSQSTPDGGPIPTKITFKKNPLITVDGKVKEVGSLQTKQDKSYGVAVKYYSNQVDFVQVVKIKGSTSITGSVEYMVGDGEKTLPPMAKAFNIKLM